MKLFYENKDYSVQSFEAVHMEFPEHLHGHVEILLVMEGSIAVRVMEKSRELGAGDCAVIFPQEIHSYHTPVESRTRLFIFDDSLTGRYLHAVRKYSPAQPFLSAGELPGDAVLALDRLYSLSGVGREPQAGELAAGKQTIVPKSAAAEKPGATEKSAAVEYSAIAAKNDRTEKLPAAGKSVVPGNSAGPKNPAAPGTTAVPKNPAAQTDPAAIELPGASGLPPPNVEELCAAWIQVLFALIWHRLAPGKRNKYEGMELTCHVVQYVMEHFQEPLTLERLARELHVNKYYISRIFSNRLQSNFRRYLNHIRLEYAMELMKAGNASLVDVCMEAGFNSLRSFHRAFAEIMGMTPAEYRKSVITYTARRLNLQCNPTADRQPGTFPEVSM